MGLRTTRQLRTLVVHTGSIGDFLLCCPALKRLNEEGPVLLAGQRDRLNLAAVCGLAQTVYSLDDIDFDSVFTEPTSKLQRTFYTVDRAIVWMKDDGTIVRQLIDCGLGDAKAFPGIPPNDWAQHASQYYAQCLGYGELPALRLNIEPDDDIRHDVIIHPGSGGAHKNWPLERFIALSDELRRAGRNVAWAIGPAEEGLAVPQDLPRIEVPSIVTFARILAGTNTYIGNDSGVTHLAAAVACKTVAIFGPTNPMVWAPLGEHVHVVHGEPWPTLAEVQLALTV